MNINPINNWNCNPVKQNNPKSKTAFGSVIRVSFITQEGQQVIQNSQNYRAIKSLCNSICRAFNEKKIILASLTNNYPKIRSFHTDTQSFFATNEDLDILETAGATLGKTKSLANYDPNYEIDFQEAKKHYKETINSLISAKNIEETIIEVKTKQKNNNTTYALSDNYFTTKKQPSKIQKEIVPEKTETTALNYTEETQNKPQINTLKEQYQPEFDFVKEIDKQNAEKIKKECYIRAIRGY